VRGFFGMLCAAFCAAVFAAPPAHAEFDLRIDIVQTPDDLADALRASSLIVQAQREGKGDPQDILAAAQADYARLVGVLYEHARYGASVSVLVDGREAAGISPLNTPSDIRQVQVRINPGPPFVFGTAQIGPIAAGTELPTGFRAGAPGAVSTIRETAQTAVDGWRAIGHAKAEIATQSLVARHDQARIDAKIRLAPGPVLSFGTVSVEGNSATRTARILKIAGLEEGRRYDPKEIEKAAARLRRTGSFSSATIEDAAEIGPGDSLPLTIGVVEATPRRIGFGTEYSTVEGLSLSGFWLHRNFLGGAERFRVDGEVTGITGETGGTDYSFGARYERPATPKADTDFFAELSFEALDEPDFTSDTSEFTLGFTRYATDILTVEAGVGYLYSDITDDFGSDVFSLITLPLAAELDRRDDPLNPSKGYFADLAITPFAGLSGTSDGAQMTFDGRAYHQAGKLTFAGRFQLGSLFGPSLEDSPAIYRFYSGGGGSVRGQDYQSLGVTQGAATTGGRSFLGLSAEARLQVTDNIQVVPFIDWGYVGPESFPDFSGDSHSGAGIGVRYHTGIGPIRLDLATPVSGRTPASDFYIYVGIGQAF